MTLLRALSRVSCAILYIGPFVVNAQGGGPLAPGDRVRLRLPGENTPPELLEVDHRGVVTLPRVGPVAVRSLEPSQLADSIRTLYARLFTTSDVTVLVFRRITVFGEVKRPGVLYLEPSSTLRDAIASAEGATELADVGHIDLMRGDTRMRINNWETASADTQPLRSGDALWVDRESWLRRNVSSLLGALGILASIAVALSR